jgi:hypothetical protein
LALRDENGERPPHSLSAVRIHHLTSFAGCQERQPRVRFPRGLLSLLSKTEALSAERR